MVFFLSHADGKRVYVSCWLKFYYPEVFAAALLNSQPMGFYQPAQIVRNAREHGVKVLPIDVNRSQWDNILEAKQGQYFALRLGFRQIDGIRQEEMEKLNRFNLQLLHQLSRLSSWKRSKTISVKP